MGEGGSLTLNGLIGLGRGRLTGWQLIGDGALVSKLNSNIGTLQRLVVSIFAGVLEQDASAKERTKLSNVDHVIMWSSLTWLPIPRRDSPKALCDRSHDRNTAARESSRWTSHTTAKWPR